VGDVQDATHVSVSFSLIKYMGSKKEEEEGGRFKGYPRRGTMW